MIYSILFIGLVIFGIYAFRLLKKKQVSVFPIKWHAILVEKVRFYRNLSEVNQKNFQKRMMLFLSEVHIEGVKLVVEDIDRILIAASAVIPVFGFEEWHYNNLSGIILYPDNFNGDLEFKVGGESKIISGLVGSGRYENQMILSRTAVYLGFENDTDKNNTPLHEFVHLIDKMDGETDGVPERLLKRQYITPWLQLMHAEMEAINNDESDIRKYGSTNQAEFFAVASEYFFERPDLFRRKHPELYDMLVACFQQKP